jgi:hypothetical protein
MIFGEVHFYTKLGISHRAHMKDGGLGQPHLHGDDNIAWSVEYEELHRIAAIGVFLLFVIIPFGVCLAHLFLLFYCANNILW